MGEHLDKAVQALKERFGATVNEFRDEVSVFLQPEQIVEACKALRDEFEFEMLEDETAVDYWKRRHGFTLFIKFIPINIMNAFACGCL